jgi:hypothetical protein
MRLIDADELIKYIKIWEIGTSISSGQKEFINCINRQLAAFDVDKVVEQLEDLKAMYWLSIANTGDKKLDVAYENVGNALDKAIEIVKGGGVE